VTTTDAQDLRGPRGGMVLSIDADIGKKSNSARVPRTPGRAAVHIIAAKAVAFGEALRPDFKVYAQNVIDNARALAAALTARPEDRLGRHRQPRHAGRICGPRTATGVSCREFKRARSRRHPVTLSRVTAGSPSSGPARLAGGTGRAASARRLSPGGHLIGRTCSNGIARNGPDGDAQVEKQVRAKVHALCSRFPIYRD